MNNLMTNEIMIHDAVHSRDVVILVVRNLMESRELDRSYRFTGDKI